MIESLLSVPNARSSVLDSSYCDIDHVMWFWHTCIVQLAEIFLKSWICNIYLRVFQWWLYVHLCNSLCLIGYVNMCYIGYECMYVLYRLCLSVFHRLCMYVLYRLCMSVSYRLCMSVSYRLCLCSIDYICLCSIGYVCLCPIGYASLTRNFARSFF